MNTSNLLEYSYLTDTGKVRDNNEDNYIFACANNTVLLGVIDGVGGYEGGEIASEITKKSLESQYLNISDLALHNTVNRLKKMVYEANNVIVSERNKNVNLCRMSCVVSFALLDKESEILHYAHVGDTRGYIYRNGELSKFTHDHSLVGYLEESGNITEEEALNHPRRNEIYKMLGENTLPDKDDTYVEAGSHSFYSKDIVLFCSDGLSDLLSTAEIEHILSLAVSLDEKSRLLVDRANQLGGRDNITVALASYINPEKDNKDEETVIIKEVEMDLQAVEKKGNRNLSKIIFPLLLLVLGLVLGFIVNTRGTNYWIKRFRVSNETIINSNDSLKGVKLKPEIVNVSDSNKVDSVTVNDTIKIVE